ncbi:MAG: SMC-Scp complex subunit ScpB, partial [Clostridia bacterium]
MQNIQEIVEALIFASGEPLSKKDLIEHIPALTTRELNKIVEDLKLKYSGDSGILLLTFNDKLQFSTNQKYGDTLAEVLTPIREKALSQSLLEVLSIVAYKQPITRL